MSNTRTSSTANFVIASNALTDLRAELAKRAAWMQRVFESHEAVAACDGHEECFCHLCRDYRAAHWDD
jgi:hypothetical protein